MPLSRAELVLGFSRVIACGVGGEVGSSDGWRVPVAVGVESRLEADPGGGGEGDEDWGWGCWSGWKARVASMEKWSLREQPRSGCRIIMPTATLLVVQPPPRAWVSPVLAKM